MTETALMLLTYFLGDRYK